MSCFLLKTCQDSSRLTAGTMCLRLKSFRWQPMFIAVNHAFTASCNVHSQCDTMPQYLIEQCLPQFVHYVSTSNHFDTIFCAHGVKICITSVTALRPRFQISQIWRFFFQFETIWYNLMWTFFEDMQCFQCCNAEFKDEANWTFAQVCQATKPQRLIDVDRFIDFGQGHLLQMLQMHAECYSFIQLHTASYSFMCLPMCRICLSLPRTHRKLLAWHAHNVGQIVHTNYTLGLAKCDHCDNMWHALYGSYMHAPIFSAVQLPLSSLRASLSFRDVSQVLFPQQRRQRLLRGIIPCFWSSVVIWCSFSKFIVLPLLCL